MPFSGITSVRILNHPFYLLYSITDLKNAFRLSYLTINQSTKHQRRKFIDISGMLLLDKLKEIPNSYNLLLVPYNLFIPVLPGYCSIPQHAVQVVRFCDYWRRDRWVGTC